MSWNQLFLFAFRNENDKKKHIHKLFFQLIFEFSFLLFSFNSMFSSTGLPTTKRKKKHLLLCLSTRIEADASQMSWELTTHERLSVYLKSLIDLLWYMLATRINSIKITFGKLDEKWKRKTRGIGFDDENKSFSQSTIFISRNDYHNIVSLLNFDYKLHCCQR